MAENTTNENIEETPEQASEDNPLDALNEEEANVVEVSDDAKYKLANGNVISGKDLANLQKGFTQSTQKYSQQIKEMQELLEAQQKETVALRDYISTYATANQQAATQTQGAYPAEDYSSYYQQAQAPPIDPNKLAEIVEAKVLQAVKSERLATERRIREEAELRAKEEAWEKKMPGIPIKEFVYKAQAAVENSDFDALLEEHLKLNKTIRAMEEKQRATRNEQARLAYRSSPVSVSSNSSSTNNEKRLNRTAMKDRIRQATAKAKEDIERLGNA